jgi:hypothetical protein
MMCLKCPDYVLRKYWCVLGTLRMPYSEQPLYQAAEQCCPGLMQLTLGFPGRLLWNLTLDFSGFHVPCL